MKPEDPLIQGIVKTCRINVRESDQLMPAFFIGSDKNVGVIAAHFDSPESKDKCAEFVKDHAKKVNADFVLFIAESWSIKDQDAAREYMANMELYDHSMANHPKAIEIVMFSLETRQRCWTAIAEIKDREIGEIEWSEAEKLEGRFSNFLGEKPTLN